jgi:hypothetical protein
VPGQGRLVLGEEEPALLPLPRVDGLELFPGPLVLLVGKLVEAEADDDDLDVGVRELVLEDVGDPLLVGVVFLVHPGIVVLAVRDHEQDPRARPPARQISQVEVRSGGLNHRVDDRRGSARVPRDVPQLVHQVGGPVAVGVPALGLRQPLRGLRVLIEVPVPEGPEADPRPFRQLVQRPLQRLQGVAELFVVVHAQGVIEDDSDARPFQVEPGVDLLVGPDSDLGRRRRRVLIHDQIGGPGGDELFLRVDRLAPVRSPG